MQEDYLSLGDAAEHAGVSRVTIWRMVKAGTLPVYKNPRDRREKLVKRAELDAALMIVPFPVDEVAGKLIAAA